MSTAKSGKDVKAKKGYYLRDGTRVPATTTITGVLDKPGLVHWAWDLGMKDIDYRSYVDDKASIGKLGHALVLEHLGGEKVNRDLYTPIQLELAQVSYQKYLLWESVHEIKVLHAEEPLVSEVYRFGGTPDLFCLLDGVPTLIDYKTAKGIYPEHLLQVAAYAALIQEIHGSFPSLVKILRIGRDEEEGFEERNVDKLGVRFEIFLRCLDIYQLKKGLKN